MNILTFCWPHNRLFKKDGDWFNSQNINFMRFNGVLGCGGVIDIPKKLKKRDRRIFIINQLEKISHKMNRIAFFCHGWPKSFDAGFDISNVGVLGNALQKVAADDCRIYLFCCSTGKLENGLAYELSKTSGLPVFAHETSGRAVRNPYKVVFHHGEKFKLYPSLKDKELWEHHKQEIEKDPFGFLERVQL